MNKATFKAKGLWTSFGAAAVAAIVAVVTAGGSLATAATVCGSSGSPESIWPNGVPTNSNFADRAGSELGEHFTSDVAGTVSAVRFYKGTLDTGTHVGALWTAAGTQLASVTFTNESASGWQTANFSNPVNVAANTEYVVSYYTPATNHPDDDPYPYPFTNQDLTATKSSYGYGSALAFPATISTDNYWVDVVFTPGASTSPSPSATSASPSTSPSASPSTSPSSSPSTSPSSSPSTSPSASPSGTPTGPTSYVHPGTVGYLGSISALTVYSRANGKVPESDCSWQSYAMRCTGGVGTLKDDTNIDHALILGSIYFSGTGALNITQSIVLGGDVSGEYFVALGHPSSSTTALDSNAGLNVSDSTLSWCSVNGVTNPNWSGTCNAMSSSEDTAPIWSIYGNQSINAQRDDLSGMPQGLPGTAGSILENNWIHNMVQNNPGSSPSHMDGIFSQGGSNVTVSGNYVDAPARGDVTAAMFIQGDASDTNISISNNYLSGGAYTLVNDTAQNVPVTNNTFAAGQYVYGYVAPYGGTAQGTYGTWTGNVDTNGVAVAKP